MENFVERNPNLKIKIVDGTSLAVAVLLHSIPEYTKSVLLAGNFTKTAYFLTLALCQKEVQVEVVQRELYKLLKLQLPQEMQKHLVLSDSCTSKVWLIRDEVGIQEQNKAAKGVHFIPFSQLPQNNLRKDCTYHSTPAVVVPEAFENLHACEN
ncbi:very-long-chain aldehyde decarbonylase GL1-6-like [Typha latifolia]|uniref:very-long-chain aldehyde decarbonylase GL1-6-like n=1 Tax=Typha latifolia TaxID=4733 RepID=UPI003C2F8F77